MTKENLEKIIERSKTLADVYEQFGFTRNPNSRNRAQVKAAFKEHGFDLTRALLRAEIAKKNCLNCGKEFVPKKGGNGWTVTCSYSCSNTYFRSGPDNGNFNGRRYRTICFYYHKKACVICGEERIVEVHHYDENKENNEPENLIPLCPTHHQYMHSRYKSLIADKVKDYVKKWKAGKSESE